MAERNLSTAKTWDAIQISFLSDERVQIWDGAQTETRNYAEFGFKDGRSGKPNEAWAVLLQLAKKGGVIRDSGNTGKDWPKIEKQVQNVRSILRAHFGLSDDPIPFVSKIGYQARFKIGCGPSFDS